VELKEFEKVLDRFADDVNNAAKRELGSRRIGKNRSYGVASRSLQKSLTYSISDGRVSFGSPNPSAPFIHWGVNGTRKKRGAPYSYKYETPGRKHVDAIVKWMEVKPVRVRDQKTGQFIKKVGPKGGDRVRSTAWVIARAIKRKGIEGLRYYVVALETIVPKYVEEMGSAVVSDILKSLTFEAGNIKIKTK
jgi:hypothetical protein